MPKFTIETTYRLPVYRHRTYEAATVEEACRMALEDQDWESAEKDYDSSGPEHITGAWKGADSAYGGEALPVPHHMAHEKGDLVAEMLAALKRCKDQLSQKRPRKGRRPALDFDLELAIAEAGKAIAKAEGRA